jgi:hypothetical protein
MPSRDREAVTGSVLGLKVCTLAVYMNPYQFNNKSCRTTLSSSTDETKIQCQYFLVLTKKNMVDHVIMTEFRLCVGPRIEKSIYRKKLQ